MGDWKTVCQHYKYRENFLWTLPTRHLGKTLNLAADAKETATYPKPRRRR
jgi:hypothetical protein